MPLPKIAAVATATPAHRFGQAELLALAGYGDARRSYAGFFIEGMERGSGTGILLEIGEPQWRESRIGRIQTDISFNFETLDATGRASATVTGLDDGRDHRFRLWLRSGQMELSL